MTVWKSFGASVIGPGHIRSGKPNQDALMKFHHTWGDGIIVSDGLGSKFHSDFGSKAACRAAASAINACRGKTEDSMETEQIFLTGRIRDNWLHLITPLDPRECSATCLFAFRLADGIIRTGMLGDGLISIIKMDGTILSLAEDKTDSFSNITYSLSKSTTNKEWRFLRLQENLCRAVLLCTDGVSDDLANTEGFVSGFVSCAVDLSCVSASRYTRGLLNNWPTPKHSDDKTIACLFRKEAGDE